MKKKALLEELAQRLGMRLDEEALMVYGSSRGYQLSIAQDGEINRLAITMGLARSGATLETDEFKSFVKGNKLIIGASVEGHRVYFTLSPKGGLKGCAETAPRVIEEIASYLQSNGYTSCCEQCGAVDEVGNYIIGGDGHILCPTCFTSIEQAFMNDKVVKSKRKSNLVAGIVGALLGSIIGVIAIVAIGQLGYVAAISGVIMGVCALKGYELLGGKITTIGIIVSCIIMVGMVYLGNLIDWAIFVSAELDLNIIDSMRAVPVLLAEDMIEPASFYGNMVMVYIFTALGAYPTIRSSLRSKDGDYVARPAAQENTI